MTVKVLTRRNHQNDNDFICIRRVMFHFDSTRLCYSSVELTYNTRRNRHMWSQNTDEEADQ